MDKEVMNGFIKEFMENYERDHKYDAPMKLDGVRKLMIDAPYSFTNQQAYEDPEYLQYNFYKSVQDIKRNKDAAIEVYKLFLKFLRTKGISAEVEFPPIPVSNSFERLMFIAKYFHKPNQKISGLTEILWVDQKTVKNDLRKLMGKDNDSLQICGEVFTIPEIDDAQKDTLTFESTAHPLFLTPNITQLIVMLKGLREMSESPLYGNSAKIAAENIWAQLSDYAKKRIPEVLQEVMSEDPAWYENLEKADKRLWHTERACSKGTDIIFYSLKDQKTFFVEIWDGDKKHLYKNCRTIYYDYDHSGNFTIISEEGEKTLSFKDVIQTAHTLDGIH